MNSDYIYMQKEDEFKELVDYYEWKRQFILDQMGSAQDYE